ncbi:alkyl hydroperoxide reductase subunit c thiol specific antioxidant protein [Diplodia corticola]|uniref:Alkyl hydroperoxide reductase subunit c thiol specific antioxidant protein n=1 Tax=Diplodia corticola TaxID=236234 RepID=A0A1J9SKT4_9PEZI|nr:alkyl hydroperoxide reductase subunit c thiol specific antioxidant protein [Diplodia corticola]OJD40221.1 alkyl hydroperoxide reductase subunit c thiol specific antioxidant protein [Diplodia corticola]
MTIQQELTSWLFPEAKKTNGVPAIGAKAPSSERLPIPGADGRPVVVTFLRHCGCPFAEKTYRNFHQTACRNPDIRFVAVSHSDDASTDRWLASLSLPPQSNVELLVDPQRDLFALWGLGASSLWHVLSPWSMYSVYRLGVDEGIWNRPTESGNRWQMAGSWAVGGDGAVRWGGPARQADDVADFEGAVEVLKNA